MKKENLLQQVLESPFFRKARRQAEEFVRNPQRLADLLQDAGIKSAKTAQDSSHPSLGGQVAALIRMVRAFSSGTYRDVSWRSIVLTVATLIYFVSPLDFIPDLLPLVGLTDDIALILWLFRSLKEDIERFRDWEEQGRVRTVSI